MTVYLEEPTINLPPYMINYARLTADDVEELHEFAGALALPRHRFYDHRIPHYRLSPGKQLQAIKQGAMQITSLERMAQIAHEEIERKAQRKRDEQEAAMAATADQPTASRHDLAMKAEIARLQKQASKQAKNQKKSRKTRLRGRGVALADPQPDTGSKSGRPMSGKRFVPKGVWHA